MPGRWGIRANEGNRANLFLSLSPFRVEGAGTSLVPFRLQHVEFLQHAVGFVNGSRALGEEGFFFIVQLVVHDGFHAVFADNGRYTDAEVAFAVFAFEVGARGDDFLLVVDDGFHHVGSRRTGCVPGRGAEQLRQRGTAHHGVGHHFVERFLVHQVGYRTAFVGGVAGEGYHGGVAVAADDDAFHFVRVGVQRLAQVAFEARAVQGAAHAEYAVLRKPRGFQRQVGHGVHRVADDEQDGVRRVFQHVFRHAFHDAGVHADEFFTRHARLAGNARGDNHHVRVGRLGIIVRAAHQARVEAEQGSRLEHVEGFAFGHAFFHVEHDHFIGHFLECKYVCTRGTYVAGTNYCYF